MTTASGVSLRVLSRSDNGLWKPYDAFCDKKWDLMLQRSDFLSKTLSDRRFRASNVPWGHWEITPFL
jgi:hypothetical protein